MIRRTALRLALAALAVLTTRFAPAATISASGFSGLTGDVTKDFAPGVNPTLHIIPHNIDDVAQAQWMTDRGWTTGWKIQDIRTMYDPATDTLAVGLNFHGIAGDADGNGDPGRADPLTLAAGGVDLPHLGGRKSITVGIDTNHSGKPYLVAGVPADKSTAGPGIDGFNVAAYKDNHQGIAWGYGQTLWDHMGQLAFDPSKDHPGFEFTITHFSTLPGLNLAKGFGIEAFAGSPDDVVAGEENVAWQSIPGTPLPQQFPEPATVLSWAIVAGLASWRLRRRVRKAGQP